MKNNSKRVARFTSSKVSVLTVAGKQEYGFGAGAITYIEEKIMELDYGRGIERDVYKEDMAWGKVWEPFVYWQLPNGEYEYVVDVTAVHPKYSFWSGSKDFTILIPEGGVSELKCYQLKNHHKYAKCLLKQSIDDFKAEFKDEYWQIVSNSCINNTKYGEAIAFMPTEANLLEMRKLLEETDYIEKNLKDDPWKYRFIYEKDLYDLPFIPSHSDFPSLVKFRFEVPIEDKIFITKKVIDADKLLTELISK